MPEQASGREQSKPTKRTETEINSLFYKMKAVFGFRDFNPLQIIFLGRKTGASQENRLPSLSPEGKVEVSLPGKELRTPLPEAVTIANETQFTPEDAQTLIQITGCAYQELLAFDLVNPEAVEAKPTGQQELWAANEMMIEGLAKSLHESYQAYCNMKNTLKPGRKPRDTQILRRNSNGELMNIANTPFDKLDPDWQSKNIKASRMFTMIFQVFDSYGYFDNVDIDRDDLTKEPLLFLLNSAQFSLWSHDVDHQATHRNPLFQARPYINLFDISNGETPWEGWDALIVKYKAYIFANAESYFPMLEAFDTNPNGILELNEVDSIDIGTLKKLIQEHAKWELKKDAVMMATAVARVREARKEQK